MTQIKIVYRKKLGAFSILGMPAAMQWMIVWLHIGTQKTINIEICGDITLHDLGVECWWRQDFSHMCRLTLGPTKSPTQCAQGLLPWGKFEQKYLLCKFFY
jgi:hypothetical protein